MRGRKPGFTIVLGDEARAELERWQRSPAALRRYESAYCG